jgi:hypothetical protein
MLLVLLKNLLITVVKISFELRNFERLLFFQLAFEDLSIFGVYDLEIAAKLFAFFFEFLVFLQ